MKNITDNGPEYDREEGEGNKPPIGKGLTIDQIGENSNKYRITVDASAYIPDDGAGHTVTVFVTDESGKTQHDTQSGCRYGDNVILTFDVLGNYESRIKIDGNYVN